MFEGKFFLSISSLRKGQYRFTAAVARAGLSSNYAENQPCGSPATRAQSYDGAVNEFLCDTPRLSRYVSLDIDPSSSGVTNALLQIGEVTLEEHASGQCAPNGKTIFAIYPLFF